MSASAYPPPRSWPCAASDPPAAGSKTPTRSEPNDAQPGTTHTQLRLRWFGIGRRLIRVRSADCKNRTVALKFFILYSEHWSDSSSLPLGRSDDSVPKWPRSLWPSCRPCARLARMFPAFALALALNVLQPAGHATDEPRTVGGQRSDAGGGAAGDADGASLLHERQSTCGCSTRWCRSRCSR